MFDSFTHMRVTTEVSSLRYKEGVVMGLQTHSNLVYEVNSLSSEPLQGDGFVTSDRSLTLGVYTADCAPICFGDGERIAIAHVGWRGLVRGIIENTLTFFDFEKIEVYIGPHLHSFEIQKDECYDLLTAKFGLLFLEQRDKKLFFKFSEAIASLLPPQAIFDARNTEDDLSLPSYRYKRMSGNIANIITKVSFI